MKTVTGLIYSLFYSKYLTKHQVERTTQVNPGRALVHPTIHKLIYPNYSQGSLLPIFHVVNHGIHCRTVKDQLQRVPPKIAATGEEGIEEER